MTPLEQQLLLWLAGFYTRTFLVHRPGQSVLIGVL